VDIKELVMKKVKEKKNIKDFGKLLKKYFLKFVNFIKNFVVDLYKKFMELPKKVRYIIGVWVVVVILLVSFIVCSNSSKKFYKKYTLFEQNISARALEYVKDRGIYATQDHKLVLDLEILKEENYIGGSELIDNTCEGISVIYYNDEKDEYVIDSYVNCDKYTSKNYWDYK
jgi:hypothetical protein